MISIIKFGKLEWNNNEPIKVSSVCKYDLDKIYFTNSYCKKHNGTLFYNKLDDKLNFDENKNDTTNKKKTTELTK